MTLRIALLGGLIATAAPAQEPPPPIVPTVPVEMLRADFVAKTGGTMVYFGVNSALIGAPARPMLAAQAQWFRLNPYVSAKIEGHGDGGDTRDHALALGARRAAAVREGKASREALELFLKLERNPLMRPFLGIAGERLSLTH